jgi:hypothetical protein
MRVTELKEAIRQGIETAAQLAGWRLNHSNAQKETK